MLKMTNYLQNKTSITVSGVSGRRGANQSAAAYVGSQCWVYRTPNRT